MASSVKTMIKLADAVVATASMAAVYTVPSSLARVGVNQGVAVNYTGAPVTLSVQVVPSGGSAANSQLRIQSVTVPANDRIYLNELVGQGMNTGDAVYAQAGSADAIAITINGTTFAE